MLCPRTSLNCSLKTPGKTKTCSLKVKCASDCLTVRVLTRTLDKGPLKASLFRTEPRLQHHVLTVSGGTLHRSAIRTLHALPSAGVTWVSTPSAVRLFQTQAARTQTRAILSCKTINTGEKEAVMHQSWFFFLYDWMTIFLKSIKSIIFVYIQ